MKGESEKEGGQRDDLQLGCYLTASDAERLTTYAESMEISRPKLCILLIVRELRSSRLPDLARRFGDDGITRRSGVRVTARAIHPEVRTAFVEHCSSHGIGTDKAVSLLCRAELSDGWLDKALGGNRP